MTTTIAKLRAVTQTPEEELEAAIKTVLAERAAIQSAQSADMKKAIAEAVEAAIKPLRDKIAAAETRAQDAAAKIRLHTAAPQRRTLAGMEGRVMAPIGDGEERIPLTMKNGAELS
jgi:hypothetical protein